MAFRDMSQKALSEKESKQRDRFEVIVWTTFKRENVTKR